jgi:tRNA pseudouridine38-40 synthase
MPRYKLTIEYDGTEFSGWQRQENGPSIQQSLEEALTRLGEATPLVSGAGRTDAGVHALGQVAHVDLERDWTAWRLREAVNAQLVPLAVAVLAVETVSEQFDARRSAIMRHYVYRIVNRRAPLTLDRGRAWRVKRDLDAAAMHEAARALIGRHDFSTFRDSQCQANSPIRTLTQLDVTREGERIAFSVAALSFLHRQVRSMVGSLIEVGLGRWSPADLKAALEAADRSRCGPVAPACGLYLERVDYPAEKLAK